MYLGIKSTVEYSVGSGRQPIAENVTLDLCSSTCQPKHVSVSLSLQTAQEDDTTSVMCEVDADSISIRNNICGRFS